MVHLVVGGLAKKILLAIADHGKGICVGIPTGGRNGPGRVEKF
jgi:hypothetical protein